MSLKTLCPVAVIFMVLAIMMGGDARGQESEEREFQGNWWEQEIGQPILDADRWVTFDLHTVMVDTLQNAPEISIAQLQTRIATERIVQQRAAFDASVLFDTGYKRVNDPVGNSLTTGGPPRLIEDGLNNRLGLSKQTTRGGVLDVSQSVGLDDSNSQFFTPGDQANTRLSLSFSQPLFDRGGELYNTRLVSQAKIDWAQTSEEAQSEVAQRLADTHQAYWSLYRQRCFYLQYRNLRDRVAGLQRVVESRKTWDSGQLSATKVQSQVEQIDEQLIQIAAALTKHQADMVRLVASPALAQANVLHEMVLATRPDEPAPPPSLETNVRNAIENRPEVRQAASGIEAAALRVRVTRAELQPQLTAVVGAYLAGLNGDFQVGRSFVDQFSTGGPGFSAGINYDMPRGRRAARSQHREAMHQLKIANERLRSSIAQVRFDVETTMTDYESTLRRLEKKRRLLAYAKQEEDILQARFDHGIDDLSSVGVVIESLLEAHQGRTDAESELVDCLVDAQILFVRLQKATGQLLQYQAISTAQPEVVPADVSAEPEPVATDRLEPRPFAEPIGDPAADAPDLPLAAPPEPTALEPSPLEPAATDLPRQPLTDPIESPVLEGPRQLPINPIEMLDGDEIQDRPVESVGLINGPLESPGMIDGDLETTKALEANP